MKYLCLAYYSEEKSAALSQAEVEKLVSACPAYDQALQDSGHVIMVESLDEPSASTVVRPRNGKTTVSDGPYMETKEQLGAFFIIDARDLNEAIHVASKHPAASLGEEVGWGIEIRRITSHE